MSRRARLVAVTVALALVVVAVTGCGADPHLQRQAAGVRSVTCQSIVERQEGRRAPDLSPTRWLDEVARPPKSLSDTINEREIIEGCLDVESELSRYDDLRSGVLDIFTNHRSFSGASSGNAAELLKLLRSLGSS